MIPQPKTRGKKTGYAPDPSLAAKPYVPAAFTLPEGYALQALERGEATPEQQQMTLKWIVNSAARTYDLSYRGDSERDSSFAEGKRFVGLQIVSLIKKNMSIYQEENPTGERENDTSSSTDPRN
jgi:hypothetical protein